jgi:antitoxin component YwqK of YwqJK toxin-antitoxin module
MKKVIAKNKNGTPGIVFEYEDRNDTLNFDVKVYYPDGILQKEATIRQGKYVGRKMTYFHNGKPYQIDSLSQPCPINIDACDGAVIRYNENGSVSQRFTVKDGEFNGLSKHYDGRGKLIKEYILTHDSIKNGLYREFYDNGRISYLAYYSRDTLTGYEYFFKENGDTVKYYNHYKGVMSFPYKIWLDNGGTLYGEYKDSSMKEVVWKWLDKSNKEIKQRLMQAGPNGFNVPQ